MTINFDISTVLVGGAVTVSLGLLVAVVRWLRRVELPAVPGWAVLLILGSGAAGFAVSDMPGNTQKLDTFTNRAVLVPAERLLPRWADGLLAGLGAALGATGIVSLGVRMNSGLDLATLARYKRIADEWDEPDPPGYVSYDDRLAKLEQQLTKLNSEFSQHLASHLMTPQPAMYGTPPFIRSGQ